MAWTVIITERFSQEFKKYSKNREFTDALEKKIQRLRDGPQSVGKYLVGRLHGYKSTRLVKTFRILFKISESESAVHLVAIDHRKHDYENF